MHSKHYFVSGHAPQTGCRAPRRRNTSKKTDTLILARNGMSLSAQLVKTQE